MLNSSYTGRAARSLDGAFGPYIRSSQCRIQPMQADRVPSFDLALYLVAVLAIIVLIGVL
jgi:hypothetical protein